MQLRAGVLFEDNRGHLSVPIFNKGTELLFRFSIGLVTGAAAGAALLPGSAGAWSALVVLAALKVVYACLLTVWTPAIDRLQVIGSATSQWLDAGAAICILALQHYYSVVRLCAGARTTAPASSLMQQLTGGASLQDQGTSTSTIEYQASSSAITSLMGVAEGSEGQLQLAVLALGALSVVMSLFAVWGFLLLRLCGMFYVRQQARPCSSAGPARQALVNVSL